MLCTLAAVWPWRLSDHRSSLSRCLPEFIVDRSERRALSSAARQKTLALQRPRAVGRGFSSSTSSKTLRPIRARPGKTLARSLVSYRPLASKTSTSSKAAGIRESRGRLSAPETSTKATLCARPELCPADLTSGAVPSSLTRTHHACRRQESRPSLLHCSHQIHALRAKYTFTDGRRHRCRPPALRPPAVRGDGRPRRRGASRFHIAALLQLHDVDAHVPAFEAAPLRYTRPTVRDVFVARRAIRGHARRRGRRDCRALRRWCEGRGVRVQTRLRAAETAPARSPRRGLWRARAPRGRVVSKTAATTKCR